MTDRLELLSVSLLDTERATVNDLKKIAHQLKLEFGWHYLLDISWILSQVDPIPASLTFIDAGAGTGVIQWYLVENGATVISVDRNSPANRFRRRYKIQGLRTEDLASADNLGRHNVHSTKTMVADWIDQVRFTASQLIGIKGEESGKVIIYNQDLSNLLDIQNDSIDVIVAVSALEHNSPQGLKKVVEELLRVIKPGGKLLATLGASRAEDWFHEPSQGWCYSETTMREIFKIDRDTLSNYADYDVLMGQLSSNMELKNNLASFYYKSGDNGMPWGNWDPQYLPVGVCKVKTEA
jgi:SAM-dependent methyltransferase